MKEKSHYFGLIFSGSMMTFFAILSYIGNEGIYPGLSANLPCIVGVILIIYGAINYPKAKD